MSTGNIIGLGKAEDYYILAMLKQSINFYLNNYQDKYKIALDRQKYRYNLYLSNFHRKDTGCLESCL